MEDQNLEVATEQYSAPVESHVELQESVAQSYDDGSTVGVESQVATESRDEMPEHNRQEYNWRKANETLSRFKDENSGLKAELEAIRRDVEQFRQTQQQPEDQGFFHGRDGDDLSSVNDVQSYVDTVIGKKERELNSAIDKVQVQSKDPEYFKKIETYQQYLTDSQKQAIMNSATPWSDAYEAVVNSAAYYKDEITKQHNPTAKRIASNTQKPGSLSSLGSSASLDKASAWESMSESDLISMGDRYAHGGSR